MKARVCGVTIDLMGVWMEGNYGRGLQGFSEDSSLFVTLLLFDYNWVYHKFLSAFEFQEKKKLKHTNQYSLLLYAN